MRRLVATAFIALIALVAFCGAGASAHGGGGATKHCKDTYFAPLYLKIVQISSKGAGCSAARELSLAYERAVTESSGAHPHTGHCFGAHSYGNCTVQSKGKKYDCYHFNIEPKKTAGLVRCTAGDSLIKFNVGD